MDSQNLDTSQTDFGESDSFSQRLVLEESQSFIEDSDVTLEEVKNDQKNPPGKSEIQSDEKEKETETSKINSDSNEKLETEDIFENVPKSNIVDHKTPEPDATSTVAEKGQKRKGSDSDEADISPPKILKSESTNSDESSKSDTPDTNHETERSSKNVEPEIKTSVIDEVKLNDSSNSEEKHIEKSTSPVFELSSEVEIADSSVEIIETKNSTSSNSFENVDTSNNHSLTNNEINDSVDDAATNKEEQNPVKNSQKTSTSSSSLNTTEDITNEVISSLTNGEVIDAPKSKINVESEVKEDKSKLNSVTSEVENDKTLETQRKVSSELSNASPQNSPQNSHETISADAKSSEPVLKKHIFYVEVTYAVNDAKDPAVKEIAQVICDDVTDQFALANKRYSDISAGGMGDISKNDSPRSSVSGPGPFQLPNRFSTISNASRLSTFSRFSTSSTSSIVSSASTLAAKMSALHNEEHFLVPDVRPVRSKEKLMAEKKLSNEQIDSLQVRWTNSEQLFKILEAIDNSHNPGVHAEQENTLNGDADDKLHTPEKQKLESIEEMSASRSEKRSVRRKRGAKTSDEDDPKKITNSENSIMSTPSTVRNRSARKMKRSASNTSEPQVEAKVGSDPFIPEGSNISAGQVVFARWTDRKYYSGVIEEHVKDNKWSVKFDDGNKKALIEDYIIAGCHSSLKGQSVYALIKKTGEYDAGIVTKLWVENAQKFRYEVEVDNGSVVKVSADEIFLTEDQARTIKEMNRITTPPGTPRLGIVSLDNIVEGKRATRSNKKYGNIFSPRPGVSGTRKMTPRKLDSEDEKSIDSKSECALEEIGGVEPELKMSTPLKSSKGPGKIKGHVKGMKRMPKYKSLDEKINNDLGPVPDDSNIFNGLSFLLVCVGGQSTNTEADSNKEKNSVDSCSTDNETKEFSKIPFLEEHLKQQIIGGGGIFYQHFEEVPPSDYDQCVLISNRPNRTAKYIQCIAAGITIVSHEWVVRCCRENKRLNYQELPIGWSLESEKFIESFHRKNLKPFQDNLIYLAPNMDKQFLKFWERVCTLAGGHVVVMDSEETDFQNATCVIADNECSPLIVDYASVWKVPLLSTVWIVQSIIHGETRDFNAHPKFAYDSVVDD